MTTRTQFPGPSLRESIEKAQVKRLNRFSRSTADTTHTMKKTNTKTKQSSTAAAARPLTKSQSHDCFKRHIMPMLGSGPQTALQKHQHIATPRNVKEAQSWLTKAAKEHKKFVASFRASKEGALTAGAFLSKAHALCDHGEWEPMLEKHGLNRMTAWRYQTLYTEAMEWARNEHATLTDETKLFQCALKLAVQSPKGLVALCRELGEMRKFGEYDPTEYQAKKLTAGESAIGTITPGTYKRVMRSLDWVTQETITVEDLDQNQIDGLADWLTRALAKVKSLRETIPVETVTTALTGETQSETGEQAAAGDPNAVPAKPAEKLFGCPHCLRTNFTAKSTHRCGEKKVLRKGKDLTPMSEWLHLVDPPPAQFGCPDCGRRDFPERREHLCAPPGQAAIARPDWQLVPLDQMPESVPATRPETLVDEVEPD